MHIRLQCLNAAQYDHEGTIFEVPLGHYEREFACLGWGGGGVVYTMYRIWRFLVKNFHRMLKCIPRKHNSDVASKYCIFLIFNIQGSQFIHFFSFKLPC